MKQRCELKKEVLRNTLSFATPQSDEFAYKLMKGPGYMVVTAGEAIHVVKCIPVEVTLRRSDACYLKLPVTVRNTSLFVIPKSRILTKAETIRECSGELPTLYYIKDTWIQFTLGPQVRQVPPQQLKPMTTLSWNYMTPGPLAIVFWRLSSTNFRRLNSTFLGDSVLPNSEDSILYFLETQFYQIPEIQSYIFLGTQSCQILERQRLYIVAGIEVRSFL